jgi:hypothetical protein
VLRKSSSHFPPAPPCLNTLNPTALSFFAADDRTLYDPELFQQVMQAVQRELLPADTVFALHQKPLPWSEVV